MSACERGSEQNIVMLGTEGDRMMVSLHTGRPFIIVTLHHALAEIPKLKDYKRRQNARY